jgi:hypothetical protein
MAVNTRVTDFCIFFPRALNFTHVKTSASRGGDVQWSDCVLSLTTSALAESTACLECYLPLYLNQEETVTATLNAAFSAPADGLRQLIGLGDSASGVFVGFDGLRFGLLERSGGQRQHWVLQVFAPCTAAGTITLTLLDQLISIDVAPGMNEMLIMYLISTCPGMRDSNLKAYLCFDRLTIYTDEAAAFTSTTPDTIDFGTTGTTGSVALLLAGAPAVEEWTYRDQFNAVTRYAVEDLDLTRMNVFAFHISRWSSGNLRLSMLNTHNNDMSLVHTWTPGGDGFNTGRPYTPHISIKNWQSSNSGTGVLSSAVSTLKSSMASVTSGTPDTVTNNTWFSHTFVASSITVTQDAKTIIGVITVPRASTTGRNFMLAAIQEFKINTSTPRDIRIFIDVNGLNSRLIPTVSHIPWSCIRRGVTSSDTTTMGGLQIASLYMRESSTERVFAPSQLWLAPGNNLTISMSAVDAPLICSVDVQVQWIET